MNQAELLELFGDIDVYLFDQLLRGRLAPGMRVLDAGCGGGRNLVFLLRSGYDVWGVDSRRHPVASAAALADRLGRPAGETRFQVADVAELPHPAEHFDVVLSMAVLHFARDPTHFGQMVAEMWRVLRPGGILFARVASQRGLEDKIHPLGRPGWFAVPDGTERFLVTDALLLGTTATLGAELLDPLKTVDVGGQRAMTTWCLRKPGRPENAV